MRVVRRSRSGDSTPPRRRHTWPLLGESGHLPGTADTSGAGRWFARCAGTRGARAPKFPRRCRGDLGRRPVHRHEPSGTSSIRSGSRRRPCRRLQGGARRRSRIGPYDGERAFDDESAARTLRPSDTQSGGFQQYTPASFARSHPGARPPSRSRAIRRAEPSSPARSGSVQDRGGKPARRHHCRTSRFRFGDGRSTSSDHSHSSSLR